MNSCNRMKRLIDESHRPDLLPIEAVAHIENCSSCRQFAGEREALRNMLALESRVTAPANFEAVLTRKLHEVKRGRSLAWLNPALYARVAFAAAALLVAAVVVPQYLNRPEQTPEPPVQTAQKAPVVQPAQVAGEASGVPVTPPPRYSGPVGVVRPAGTRYGARLASPVTRSPGTYIGGGGAGVMLIRGQDGDFEMPIRPVSVGAEPLVYPGDVGSARRSTRTSF